MQPFDQRISIVILSTVDRLEMKEAAPFSCGGCWLSHHSSHFDRRHQEKHFLPPEIVFARAKTAVMVSSVPVALSAAEVLMETVWMERCQR